MKNSQRRLLVLDQLRGHLIQFQNKREKENFARQNPPETLPAKLRIRHQPNPADVRRPAKAVSVQGGVTDNPTISDSENRNHSFKIDALCPITNNSGIRDIIF